MTEVIQDGLTFTIEDVGPEDHDLHAQIVEVAKEREEALATGPLACVPAPTTEQVSRWTTRPGGGGLLAVWHEGRLAGSLLYDGSGVVLRSLIRLSTLNNDALSRGDFAAAAVNPVDRALYAAVFSVVAERTSAQKVTLLTGEDAPELSKQLLRAHLRKTDLLETADYVQEGRIKEQERLADPGPQKKIGSKEKHVLGAKSESGRRDRRHSTFLTAVGNLDGYELDGFTVAITEPLRLRSKTVNGKAHVMLVVNAVVADPDGNLLDTRLDEARRRMQLGESEWEFDFLPIPEGADTNADILDEFKRLLLYHIRRYAKA